MSKIFETGTKITGEGEFPKIQVGDKLYPVDVRKRTYDTIQTRLVENSKLTAAKKRTEEEIILEHALGETATKELYDLDLPFSGWFNLFIYVMAAIMDTTFEEAEKRFQKYGF